MLKRNKNYVFASLFITIIVLVPLFFTFHQKMQNDSASPNSIVDDFETCGPHIGYVSDSDREKIDIYTNTNGEYVTSVTTEIVSNFLNQNYEQEQPTYKVAADFYCGVNENLKWVYVASKPVFHSSIVNLYTSLENNEKIENHYFDITNGGVVTGAVFVSEKIGFIGLSVPTELGFEIYATLDSGISWSLVEIEPPSEWSNSYSMIPVVNGFNIDEGIYPFVIDKKPDKKIIYLTTDDSGNTWCWKE